MKVDSVFSDYDGTLAPSGVTRESSRIPRQLESAMTAIASRVPVAIITSKDFAFVQPRTKFANAWACICGLEIRLDDGRTLVEEEIQPLRQLPALIRNDLLVEEKRDSCGRLLGFSLDWRGHQRPSEASISGILALSEKGLCVRYEPPNPFIDIFVAPPDKGRALNVLKREFGVKRVMFIGDSMLDNAAFREADITIGIDHGQPQSGLECQFMVEYKKLGQFLRTLLAREMDFSPSILTGECG